MQRNISHFSNRTFDLLVIGGGINGAAIANVASLNGLNVALIEKGDFASGTSSKSTKLLHGGLRYLENFEFDLVSEALRERHVHLKSAPHLVKVLPFVIPVYKDDPRPLWKMRLGVWLYDVLSGTCGIGRHQNLSPQEVLEKIPGLKAEGLQGGVLYYDMQMNDARLCLENVLMAADRGAVVANYVAMDAFLTDNGRCVGVSATDQLTGQSFEIRATNVVSCAGVWSEAVARKDPSAPSLRVRATKGVHLIHRRKISDSAVFLQGSDGRVFFAIPWGEHSLIGTTDTDYAKDLDRVPVDPDDIRYLVEQTRRFFSDMSFDARDIVGSFAGLRPLVHAQGSPSKISRKHLIHVSASGVVYVIGGKYTTYRIIAQDALKTILGRPLKDTSKNYPLYGGGEAHLEHWPGLTQAKIRYLLETYGTRYPDVLHTQGDSLLEKQIRYAREVEMAMTADDVLRRLGHLDDASEAEKDVRKSFS